MQIFHKIIIEQYSKIKKKKRPPVTRAGVPVVREKRSIKLICNRYFSEKLDFHFI